MVGPACKISGSNTNRRSPKRIQGSTFLHSVPHSHSGPSSQCQQPQSQQELRVLASDSALQGPLCELCSHRCPVSPAPAHKHSAPRCHFVSVVPPQRLHYVSTCLSLLLLRFANPA